MSNAAGPAGGCFSDAGAATTTPSWASPQNRVRDKVAWAVELPNPLRVSGSPPVSERVQSFEARASVLLGSVKVRSSAPPPRR